MRSVYVILLSLLVVVLIAAMAVSVYMLEWSGTLVDRLPR